MNWKDIPEYEGLYQVSDCGQVKSLDRFVKHRTGSNMFRKGKILSPGLTNQGYQQVFLCKDGKKKDFRVHRLVALVFLDGDNSLTVNHIDECKTNNHVSNLEYLTQGDNTRSWNKNNPERRAEINTIAGRVTQGIYGKKVLDTQTGKIFPSIKAVSRYMYEEEGAKGSRVWYHKVRLGKQDRFVPC